MNGLRGKISLSKDLKLIFDNRILQIRWMLSELEGFEVKLCTKAGTR